MMSEHDRKRAHFYKMDATVTLIFKGGADYLTINEVVDVFYQRLTSV
jgi:hypothetical protein